jgi:O-antigen ligase
LVAVYLIFIASMFIAAGTAVITMTSKHRLVLFLLTFWILAGQVYDGQLAALEASFLMFDLRMERVLLFAFSAFAVVRWTLKARGRVQFGLVPGWVRWGLLYFVGLGAVNVVHLSRGMPLRDFVINMTVEGTFFLVLYVVATTVSRKGIRVIVVSIIAICLISSLVGILQFFVDTDFFRYGVERPAFGGKLRSNGVFATDHVQAYWLIAGMNLSMLTIRTRWLSTAASVLLGIGLILTFHRMSWLVASVLAAIYLVRVQRMGFVPWLAVGTVVLASVVTVPYTNLARDVTGSALVQERLTEDTGGYRLLFTGLVLASIPNHPILGVGSASSSEYYSMVIAEGLSEETARGEYGGIHNTYLQIAYFKGLPIGLLFVIFLVAGMRHLSRAPVKSHVYGYLGFAEILKFGLACLTNGILLGSGLGILMAIHLGMAIGTDPARGDTSVAI